MAMLSIMALIVATTRPETMLGDTAVAVVADTWWQAKTALDALPIVWDEGPNAKVSSASIAAINKAALDAPQAFVGNDAGDARKALAGAAKKVEAVYSYPYQNHAPMEPMNATARYTADKCEVWVPTQNGEAAFAATLAASGLPADKCEVYKIHCGGGFGRRGAFHDYVTQAVLIAKQMPGVPVKLLYSGRSSAPRLARTGSRSATRRCRAPRRTRSRRSA